jgi:hypothetical protein
MTAQKLVNFDKCVFFYLYFAASISTTSKINIFNFYNLFDIILYIFIMFLNTRLMLLINYAGTS